MDVSSDKSIKKKTPTVPEPLPIFTVSNDNKYWKIMEDIKKNSKDPDDEDLKLSNSFWEKSLINSGARALRSLSRVDLRNQDMMEYDQAEEMRLKQNHPALYYGRRATEGFLGTMGMLTFAKYAGPLIGSLAKSTPGIGALSKGLGLFRSPVEAKMALAAVAQKGMFSKALENRVGLISEVDNYNEFQKIMQVERIARGRVLAIGRLIVMMNV